MNIPNLPEIKYTINDFNSIEIIPGTVLVTYQTEKKIVNSSKKTHSLRSSIWQNQNGKWQMIFHQGTPLNV